MTRRIRHLIVLAGTLAAVARGADRPNIVLILADDLGYGDVGCYGATKVKTPNMDQLAREGRRFTDAHAASSVCSPSRYALLTGEYPFRRNLWKPLSFRDGLVIGTNRMTLPRLLRQQGYATAAIGKWHLGFGENTPDWNGELKPGPLEVGFDYYFGLPVVSSSPPFVYVENHGIVGLDPRDPLLFGPAAAERIHAEPFLEKNGLNLVGGAKAAHDLYRDDQLGTTFTSKSTSWIREHRDRPFFLYLAAPHIHHPFTPAARFKDSSPCGRYGDWIQELDWMVGEVLRTLDALGLRENTLVILTSDNGGMLNLGGQDAWRAGHRMNGDLLGFKFDAWEGGHRVPFIARWPGHIEPGSVSDQLICHVDFLATAAALTGARPAGPDSVNILPALTGAPAKAVRDHVILAPNRPTHLALRQGKWLYIGAQGGGGWSAESGHLLGGPAALQFAGQRNSDIAAGRIRPDAPAAQLYDLEADPAQTTNVIRQHAEVAGRLKELLRKARPPGAPPAAPTH